MRATLDFSTPHVLRTAAEYDAAVAEIDTLLDADPASGTPDAERLEFLAVLVEAYEDANLPELPRARPADVVAFALEQQGRDRSELAPLMGGRSRVSEFFSGKRSLSLAQVRALRDSLGLPADVLID